MAPNTNPSKNPPNTGSVKSWNHAKEAILAILLDDLEIGDLKFPPPPPEGWPPLSEQPLTHAAFQAFVKEQQLETRELTQEQLDYINAWSKELCLEQMAQEAREAFG